MSLGSRIEAISGWGRHPVQKCRIFRPERHNQIHMNPLALPRGLGRSYGDAALNAEADLVETLRLNKLLSFDEDTGLLVAQAGASLADIAATFLPRGWFLPVTPGTKFVTLGGALAADVHGKNHHAAGTFSQHIAWLDLFTPAGVCLRCSPVEHSEVFWATVGGMGLTGTISTLAVSLQKIEGPWVEVRHSPARDLAGIFRCFDEDGGRMPYSVAWLDGMASGSSLGRGVFMSGRHVVGTSKAVEFPRTPAITVPFDLPGWVLNPLTIRVFNNAYFELQSRKYRPFLSSLNSFFYPLDVLGGWNRIYGSSGFVQYQCVLPETGAFEGIQKLLEAISGAGAASFLTVLKRLGPTGQGFLSFPMAGFTLALDMPFRGLKTLDLLKGLDELVVLQGGRVNLCKDAHLSPEAFRAMYPRFGEWLACKQSLDPEWGLESSLSKRLQMKEGAR